MKKIILMFTISFLVSCSSQSLEDYKDETPKLDLKTFFNGKIFAQGIVQNRSGKIIKRFEADIDASWKGDAGVLDEKFTYSDKTKSTRVWKLTATSNQTYGGVAGDVVGVAHGETSGNAFSFKYKLDVPVGDSNYVVHMDDWMYLLDENTILGKTLMTKWGFKVGEVTIIMRKVK